jgi:hypothetical protein
MHSPWVSFFLQHSVPVCRCASEMLCEYNMRMTKARLNVCCLHDPFPEISFPDKLFVTRMLMSLEISHTEQF